MGDLQRAAGATERLFELLDDEARDPRAGAAAPLPAPLRGALALRAGELRLSLAAGAAGAARASSSRSTPARRWRWSARRVPARSSVFQLLMRFYDPSAGRVRLDGVDLRELDPAALRARIGLVPQEPVIFSANAWTTSATAGPRPATPRCAPPRARPRRPSSSTPAGGLRQLPRREGVRLSGGQRQRIAIARGDPARAGGAPARRGDQLARRRERASRAATRSSG